MQNARVIFDKGPANATFILSNLGFWRLYGFTGTGLAHPNKTEEPNRINIKGRRIEPNISRCGIGLRVNRPAYLAVGSPCLRAT